jgi:hypothetical protein
LASRTFNIPKNKDTPKPMKTAQAIDVAARYFVYKLYEATNGLPKEWHELRGLGEAASTISRAVERGWIILQKSGGKHTGPIATLTDDGRRLGRRGRR